MRRRQLRDPTRGHHLAPGGPLGELRGHRRRQRDADIIALGLGLRRWKRRLDRLFDRLDRAASALASLWPTPTLVPALVLHDRQEMAINWHTVRNLLIATPTGQGADVPLRALVAALASVRAPEDLVLVVIAGQHSLPREIGLLPHGIQDVVDSGVTRT
jgi:hypothetical protein